MDIVRAATWVAVRQHIPAEAVQQQPGAHHAHQSYGRVEMGHSAVIGGACERTPQCATAPQRACKRTLQCITGLQGGRGRETLRDGESGCNLFRRQVGQICSARRGIHNRNVRRG